MRPINSREGPPDLCFGRLSRTGNRKTANSLICEARRPDPLMELWRPDPDPLELLLMELVLIRLD